MSKYSLIEPNVAFPLPQTFNFNEYIDIEREFWALFPETRGRRVTIAQAGFSALVYAQVPDNGAALTFTQAYMLMPCKDLTIRPIRMEACRMLTRDEYRMAVLTAIKFIGMLNEVNQVTHAITCQILGQEVLFEDVMARLANYNSQQQGGCA